MKNFHKIGLSAVLAAGLLGCQTQLPLVSQLQDKASVDGQTTAAPVVSAGDLPKVNLVSQQGQVTITIKWPERQIQAIPTSTNTIRIRFTPSEGDAISDVIARDPMNPTVTRSYNLKKGVTYSVEVKAFQQLAAAVTANGDSLTAIATGTGSISVGADETKPLSITLDALYQPVLTSASYVAGVGAEIQLTGSGFGTDPSQITAYVTTSNDPLNPNVSPRTALPIATMSDTVITVTVPNASGKIVVKRDGVAATNVSNTISRLTNYFYLRPEQANLKSSSRYYAITGVPFSMPADCWGYDATDNWRQFTNYTQFTYSASVKNASGNSVTDQVYSNGQFTLPSEGKYTIAYTSGNQTATTDVYGAGLLWDNTPPTALTIAPYPLQKLNNSGTVNDSFDLGNYGLDPVDSALIAFDRNDFTWTGNPTNQVLVDTNSNNPVRFKARTKTIAAQTVSMTGKLNYDTSKQLVIPVNIVRLQSIELQYLDDANVNPTTATNQWLDFPVGGLTVNRNNAVRVRVKSYRLTNGALITMGNDYPDRYNLPQAWEVVDSGVFGITTSGTNQIWLNGAQYNSCYEATVTAGGATGTATVKVHHPDDTTVFGTGQIMFQ